MNINDFVEMNNTTTITNSRHRETKPLIKINKCGVDKKGKERRNVRFSFGSEIFTTIEAYKGKFASIKFLNDSVLVLFVDEEKMNDYPMLSFYTVQMNKCSCYVEFTLRDEVEKMIRTKWHNKTITYTIVAEEGKSYLIRFSKTGE